MNLQPARFNAFGARAGQSIEWRKAYECPCRDPSSGAPSPDCQVCTNGQIYKAPVCTHLALTGQKLMQQWANFGLSEKGDVVCSLLSDTPVYAMGEYDRVRFSNSSQPFSLALQDITRPIMLDFEVVELERLFWLNDELTEIVEGQIPTMADDGTLRFGSVRPPPLGKQFTLTGRRRPEYFCFQDFPQDRSHFGGLALPRLVVLRSWDLFKRAR